jgi:hypothetical protein
MRQNTAHLVLSGLAVLAGLAAQAASPAASATTQADALVDARPYLLLRSAEAKIDTLTNPGTLILVK